jgi:hypothetical protein
MYERSDVVRYKSRIYIHIISNDLCGKPYIQLHRTLLANQFSDIPLGKGEKGKTPYSEFATLELDSHPRSGMIVLLNTQRAGRPLTSPKVFIIIHDQQHNNYGEP